MRHRTFQLVLRGDGLIWVPQNSVIFEKYFFGHKKILKNYKNWMVL
jgi:hypothetical protein